MWELLREEGGEGVEGVGGGRGTGGADRGHRRRVTGGVGPALGLLRRREKGLLIEQEGVREKSDESLGRIGRLLAMLPDPVLTSCARSNPNSRSGRNDEVQPSTSLSLSKVDFQDSRKRRVFEHESRQGGLR